MISIRFFNIFIAIFLKNKTNNLVLVLKKGATKKQMDNLNKKLSKKTVGVNTKKFCGVIKLKEDPLTIQKQMRGEWQ
jgi:hypothetical protein